MKYIFPITATNRSLVPAVDKVLSSVEESFKTFTGEEIKLSYGETQVMTLTINTTAAITADQKAYVKSTLQPMLKEHFPQFDISVGEPVEEK